MLILLLISSSAAFDFKSLDYTKYKTNPQYGVTFRAVHDNFLPTDSYLALVFTIPFPELPVMPIAENIDPGICRRNYSIPSWQVRQTLFMAR